MSITTLNKIFWILIVKLSKLCRFSCGNSTEEPLNIGMHKVCDMSPDCADQSDELSCSDKTHFTCNAGIDKFIARSKVKSIYRLCPTSLKCVFRFVISALIVKTVQTSAKIVSFHRSLMIIDWLPIPPP